MLSVRLKKSLCLGLLGVIMVVGGSEVIAGVWSCPTDGTVGCIVVPRGTWCCRVHTNRGHNGVDIANRTGTEIGAARRGTVLRAREGWNSGYGNMVVIIHPNPSRATRYAHLDRILVREGETVELNATIGTMGSTGASTGPHLHWEIRASEWGTVYRTTNLSRGQRVTRGMDVHVND